MYKKEQKLVIANWKMNFTIDQAKDFCKLLNNSGNTKGVIISAPTPYLAYLADKFLKIEFAAQNSTFITEDFGPYTGEFSAKMMKSININYAICGHSERRKYFHESDESVIKMARNLVQNDINPIICIGESSKIGNKNRLQYLFNQIEKSVPVTPKHVIIAYEPLWAVGTGVMPSYSEVSDIIMEIKPYISKIAKRHTIVYGGSVDAKSALSLSKIKLLDGVLVGSSSLKFVEFMEIVKVYA